MDEVLDLAVPVEVVLPGAGPRPGRGAMEGLGAMATQIGSTGRMVPAPAPGAASSTSSRGERGVGGRGLGVRGKTRGEDGVEQPSAA